MTTSGTRGSKGLADGVALGVDTHLDFHVAVVWPAPGQFTLSGSGSTTRDPIAKLVDRVT